MAREEDWRARRLYDSLSLFVAFGTEEDADAVDVYNRWSRACGIAAENPRAAAEALEILRRLLKTDRGALTLALKHDGLI